MFGQLASTFILLGSISSYAPNSRVEQRKELRSSYNTISGVYNFKDAYSNENSLDGLFDEQTTFYYSFDTGNYQDMKNCCFISWNDTTRDDQRNFIYGINLTFYPSEPGSAAEIVATFLYLIRDGTSGSRTVLVYDGYDVTDFNYGDLIFYYFDSFFVSDNQAKMFNAVFTKEDNYYTRSYDGYYNFVNPGAHLPYYINVYGIVNFNNSIYYCMTQGYDQLNFFYMDYDINSYAQKVYTYPFSTTQVAKTNNILFSGVKMRATTYTMLEQVGVFSYVKDTAYENATFSDLLFSVMDTPIYFISRLLSFELFGVNLFVAFTGLLTVCVVLVLIRKFF